MTDLEQVVPCVPGAQLEQVVDGEYRGRVTARIGPITVIYAGAARFVERDDVDRRAIIALRGHEEGGAGTVNASVTTALRRDGDRTLVALATDLDVTGKAAQFGRGILGDVTSSMLRECAGELERMVSAPASTVASGQSSNGSPGDSPQSATPVAALDVRRTVLAPMLRRAGVPAALAVAAGIGGWFLGRRARTSAPARWTAFGLAALAARVARSASRS